MLQFVQGWLIVQPYIDWTVSNRNVKGALNTGLFNKKIRRSFMMYEKQLCYLIITIMGYYYGHNGLYTAEFV